jgi:flagellar assembly factor FliW
MKYETTRFGVVEFRDDTIINFPDGIIGFESYSKFVILGNSDNSMFSWLQSIEEPSLAFVIISPYDFKSDYSLEIEDSDIEKLEVTASSQIVVYAIVVVPEDPKNMTANLQAPLIINAEKRLGRQIISNNPKHCLRHHIIEEIQKSKEKKVAE